MRGFLKRTLGGVIVLSAFLVWSDADVRRDCRAWFHDLVRDAVQSIAPAPAPNAPQELV